MQGYLLADKLAANRVKCLYRDILGSVLLSKLSWTSSSIITNKFVNGAEDIISPYLIKEEIRGSSKFSFAP